MRHLPCVQNPRGTEKLSNHNEQQLSIKKIKINAKIPMRNKTLKFEIKADLSLYCMAKPFSRHPNLSHLDPIFYLKC